MDDVTYALGYGAGHRLIPDELKDQRFELSFVVRRVDPEEIQDIVRRTPTARGRTDTTVIPAGLPIWTLGMEGYAHIIRRLGGRLTDARVTFSSRDNRPVSVDGAVGVHMRFGVEPGDLIADIREIARVCTEEKPDPALEFVENIQPIVDKAMRADLDAALDALLGYEEAPGNLMPVVPTSLVTEFGVGRSYTIKIGSAPPRPVNSLELTDFLRRTRLQPAGQRVEALRNGHVQMYADGETRNALGGASALKWLEANLPLESRRFFLLDGDWYEIDAEYVRAMHAEIAGLFAATPSLDLPAWDPTADRTEYDYNVFVAGARPGFVCLDRERVRGPLRRRGRVEICDLLGPGDELVHVKRAKGAEPLSHLFSQGLVSAKSLLNSSETRAQFAEKVRTEGKGRTVPPYFTPAKVVFAIMLENGKKLTADTLFPFAQVALADTARILRSHQIDVEVIGIDAVAA